MNTELSHLTDPTCFADNRLPAHSDHLWYATEAEVASGRSSFQVCLDGVWKLHYATNPSQAVEGFEVPSYDVSEWDDIAVPAHLQIGRAHV